MEHHDKSILPWRSVEIKLIFKKEYIVENNLQTFVYNSISIRTVHINGQAWFVLKDVCGALGISNHKMAAQRLDEDEVSQTDLIDSLGRKQLAYIVNESGLYNVILRSDKPEAKPFRKWVTSEVLPSVRTTGVYMTGNAADRILQDPDFIIQLATQVKERNAQLAAAKEKIALDAPKVEYFDRAVERGDNLSFRDTAKVLGVSQSTLINFLGINHYIYRDQKGRLRPYSQYEQNGLFTVKEFERETNGYSSVQTLVTFKGRDYFSKKISSAKNAQ